MSKYSPGDKRGTLTMIGRGPVHETAGGNRVSTLLVRCDCGVGSTVMLSNWLRCQACVACGRTKCDEARTVHGEAHKTRLYRVWANMRWRCESKSADNYRWYGARGIAVCAEWQEFIPFRDWARSNGYADNLTIDRLDPAKGYEPSNCQWITQSENSKKARAAERIAA